MHLNKKLQLSPMKYSLIFLLFLLTDCKPNYTEKKTTSAKQQENISSYEKKRGRSKDKPLLSDDFTIQNKTDKCPESGVTVFPEEHFSIGSRSRKLSKRVLKILEKKEQQNPKNCPEGCRQKNTYKAFIQISPISNIPDSCPLPESKEVYAFKKIFTLLENTKVLKPQDLKMKNKKTSHQKEREIRKKLEKQMENWILRTFVYPYTPGMKFKPTNELLKHKIGDACPKCSFYFDYNYFFEGAQLNLDIKVQCGNRKKGFGFTRAARLQIKNHWQCLDAGKTNQ